MLENREAHFNGNPINNIAKIENNRNSESFEEYVNNRVMKDEKNPGLLLLMLVPIALRINIYIVNVNSGIEAKVIIFIILNLFRLGKLLLKF